MNDERQQTLGRVGLALIVFGSLDIGVMIYCIVQRIINCADRPRVGRSSPPSRPGTFHRAGWQARA